MSRVWKYLDISTGNLTEEEWKALTSTPPEEIEEKIEGSIIFAKHEYGGWLWVLTEDEHRDQLATIWPNVAAVMRLAAGLGCNWINFDQDSEPDAALPSFSW